MQGQGRGAVVLLASYYEADLLSSIRPGGVSEGFLQQGPVLELVLEHALNAAAVAVYQLLRRPPHLQHNTDMSDITGSPLQCTSVHHNVIAWHDSMLLWSVVRCDVAQQCSMK